MKRHRRFSRKNISYNSKGKILFFREEDAVGRGKYIYSDGTCYEGEWENGKRQGKGILTLSDGRKLFGKWNLGGNSDKGIVTTPGGFKLEGEFNNVKNNGKANFISDS